MNNYTTTVRRFCSLFFCLFEIFSLSAGDKQTGLTLTLIPPTTVTDKVNLDVRAGIVNKGELTKQLQMVFYLNNEDRTSMIYETSVEVAPKSSDCVKFMMPTQGKKGINTIILVVKNGAKVERLQRRIEIISSNIRSTQTIDGAWLYRVARNIMINRGRKMQEEEMPVSLFPDDEDNVWSDFAEVLFNDEMAPSPETEYLRSLVWTELETALSDLPPEQREVFELTELDSIPVKDISASTGVPVNTLLSRKHYAVKFLRKRMADLYNEILYS